MQDQPDRPERPLVRHLVGAEEILECDAGDRLAAAVVAGVDWPLRLFRHFGIVHGQFVAAHDDLHLDRDRRIAAGAVVVEVGFGCIGAVRHRPDEIARPIQTTPEFLACGSANVLERVDFAG